MKDKEKKVIEQIEREKGPSHPLARLAALDPDFTELFSEKAHHLFEGEKALPRKVKQLLALCANATEPNEAGFRSHLRQALEAGATKEEVLEALEVCALVGVRYGFAFLDVFVEEVEGNKGGQQESRPEKSAEALIELMDREQGLPEQWRNIVAGRDPDYMQIYHDTVMHVFDHRKALPRKVKEIIAAYLDMSIFCEPGFRYHVRQALKAGATGEQIFEMMELATMEGIHSLVKMLTPLNEEIESYRKSQSASQ
jgi:alkylhydroperoxidase/carboxymuconolactone decarboxylase family protein YurZ